MGRDGSGDWGSTEACLVVHISGCLRFFVIFNGFFFVVFLIRLGFESREVELTL